MAERRATAPRHSGPGIARWLPALPVLLYAGLADLWAPDEPRYAAVAREVWERPDFLVMHVNGEVYPDKPPLVFWLSALSGRLGGWSELALRLPSLLATLVSAWLVGRIAARWWGELEARWAPFLFLSTLYVFHFGGRLQLDPLLAALCLGAIALLDAPTADACRARRLAWGAGACAGLGALVKGPVAWLHAFLPFLVWRLWLRPRGSSGVRRGALAWIGFAALLLLPVLIWAGLAAWVEPSLAADLFWGQHLGRVVEATQHRRPMWKYVATLPPMLLPWTVVCVAALRRAIMDRRRTREAPNGDVGLQKAASWLVALVVLFSILPVKRILYLVPAYPAVALLCARYVAESEREGRLTAWVRWLTAGALALFGASVLAAPRFAEHLAWLTGGRSTTQILETLGHKTMVVGSATLVVGIFVLLAKDARAFATRVGLGFTLVGTLYAGLCVPDVNRFKSARLVAGFLAEREERPAAIPCYGVSPEGYRYYARVPTVSSSDLVSALEREGAEFLAVVEGTRWERLPPEERRRFSVLLDSGVSGRRILVLGRGPQAPERQGVASRSTRSTTRCE